MGYLGAWKVIEEMIIDLREKGILIPTETMTELQSAKTLVHVLEADSSKTDVTEQIDKCIFSLESYIMSKAEMVFGPEYVENWFVKLDQAKECPEEPKKETKSVPNIPHGLPRGTKWIRISPSTLPIDESKKIADALHLDCTVQDEGFLLVQGEDVQLRELVRMMAAKYEKRNVA